MADCRQRERWRGPGPTVCGDSVSGARQTQPGPIGAYRFAFPPPVLSDCRHVASLFWNHVGKVRHQMAFAKYLIHIF